MEALFTYYGVTPTEAAQLVEEIVLRDMSAADKKTISPQQQNEASTSEERPLPDSDPSTRRPTPQ
jgi:hypothetical protein